MRSIIAIVISVFVLSCDSGKTPKEEDFKASQESKSSERSSVDREMINAILQQIPSPIEISVMLRESGNEFNPYLVNDPRSYSLYNTNYQKALNIGVYGTDLGYSNIYSRNQEGLEYMGVIKEMADDLSIGQYFDLEITSRLATNSKNLDSLLLITTQNFNSINEYLQDQRRSNLSVLLLLGGWLEAMHITSQLAVKSENKDLYRAIGEQKIVLESFTQLLKMYKGDIKMTSLKEEIKPLSEVYQEIEISVERGEPTYEVVDGVMIINDNSKSTVNISEGNVNKIAKLVSGIRNNIIK